MKYELVNTNEQVNYSSRLLNNRESLICCVNFGLSIFSVTDALALSLLLIGNQWY